MWARGREERREKVAAGGRKNSVGAGEPGGTGGSLVFFAKLGGPFLLL